MPAWAALRLPPRPPASTAEHRSVAGPGRRCADPCLQLNSGCAQKVHRRVRVSCRQHPVVSAQGLNCACDDVRTVNVLRTCLKMSCNSTKGSIRCGTGTVAKRRS